MSRSSRRMILKKSGTGWWLVDGAGRSSSPLLNTLAGIQWKVQLCSSSRPKLRKVKTRLSNWHRHHRSDIKGRVAKAKEIWDEAQTMVDRAPHSVTAKNKEREAAKQY
ncbi:hypothetical protein OIU84_005815 [Salix udensis]|uniref:Uncharacterized protein n=1 Tax=Salix udensis TaxID=889485 RepID=A0AAD6JYJ5_9ROSI|nr:hypothetical protein OIU84_005815 [Salix udensis]